MPLMSQQNTELFWELFSVLHSWVSITTEWTLNALCLHFFIQLIQIELFSQSRKIFTWITFSSHFHCKSVDTQSETKYNLIINVTLMELIACNCKNDLWSLWSLWSLPTYPSLKLLTSSLIVSSMHQLSIKLNWFALSQTTRIFLLAASCAPGVPKWAWNCSLWALAPAPKRSAGIH